MGFQDRGYYADSRRAGFMAEWSGVNTIIAINVGVWLANLIFSGNLFDGLLPRFSLNELFCLPEDLPRQPQHFYTLLTYGFLHDQSSPWHLLFNMLTLWFFGREIENALGKAEFLRFYCAAIIFAGLGWVVVERFSHPDETGLPLVGASGGVMAVLAAFIWYYPRQTLLLYGVLPVPAWALGLLYLVSDIGGIGNRTSNVAHVAHLAGALFGMLYAWRGWNLDGLLDQPRALLNRWFQRRPRMRIVRPDDDERATSTRPGDDPQLDDEVDRILEKISRSGEGSLTAAERDTLTRASQRLRQRNRS